MTTATTAPRICERCLSPVSGKLADGLCRACRGIVKAEAEASWRKPAILRAALADWAGRDESRPGPEALADAARALAAIDATVAELAALRARLEREIAASGTGQESPAAAAATPPAAEPEPEPGLGFSAAARALEAAGYEPAEAYDILFYSESHDAYRDSRVTVTMRMDRMTPLYSIGPAWHPSRDGARRLALVPEMVCVGPDAWPTAGLTEAGQ